jgi:hypothetical protein
MVRIVKELLNAMNPRSGKEDPDNPGGPNIAWWLSLYPGMAILITVPGYNLLGEGIRDALDPRLRR